MTEQPDTSRKGTNRTRKSGGAARAGRAVPVQGDGLTPRVGEEMWALVYDSKEDGWETSTGYRKARVEKPYLDEAMDPLDAANVILRVHYTGFCGTDLGIWQRGGFKSMIHKSLEEEGKTTRVMGHEVLGEVWELGSIAAAQYGLKKGDIVAAESHIVSPDSYQTQIGQENTDPKEKIIGITRDGGFAEYIKLPASVLWRTDTTKIRPEVGAIQEPFGNAVHACQVCDLRGKTVAIFGCGAIGQFTILIARALGATRIIGVEPDKRKAATAKKLGADHVVRFTPDNKDWRADTNVVDEVVKLSGIDGADVCIEMAGFNSSVNNALQSVRHGGEVVLFGLKAGDFKIQDFARSIVKGITIHSVIGRKIFATWAITRSLLEANNGIHDHIWETMLKQGRGTIVDIKRFEPDSFEKRVRSHAKVLIKWK